MKSRIAENLAYLHLRELPGDVFFSKNNEEIDFLIGGLAIEVKFQNRIAESDYRSIAKFKGQKFVITKNTFDVQKDTNLLPLELFFADKS